MATITYGWVKWSQASAPSSDLNAYDVWYDTTNSVWKMRNAANDDWDELEISSVSSVGDTGIFGGGWTGVASGVLDYITISSEGNATDFGDLTVTRRLVPATSNGATGRGVFSGGKAGGSTYYNIIDYVTITSAGNATDFGDNINSRSNFAAVSNGSNDRGCWGGGQGTGGTIYNIIDYITISSTGNSTDFGDLTVARGSSGNNFGGCSNGTSERGIFAGGTTKNVIDYITISSTGNATDFGDRTITTDGNSGTSNDTDDRGVFAGGVSINVIEYITISIVANATDFGDLTTSREGGTGTSNGINNKGIFGGGTSSNIIDYITISSTGNAIDFGDLTIARHALGATSDSAV